MKARPILAGALVVLGVVALAQGGFHLGRRRERVEMGPVELEVQQRRFVEVPPLVGGLLLAGGVALLLWRPRGPGS